MTRKEQAQRRHDIMNLAEDVMRSPTIRAYWRAHPELKVGYGRLCQLVALGVRYFRMGHHYVEVAERYWRLLWTLAEHAVVQDGKLIVAIDAPGDPPADIHALYIQEAFSPELPNEALWGADSLESWEEWQERYNAWAIRTLEALDKGEDMVEPPPARKA